MRSLGLKSLKIALAAGAPPQTALWNINSATTSWRESLVKVARGGHKETVKGRGGRERRAKHGKVRGESHTFTVSGF